MDYNICIVGDNLELVEKVLQIIDKLPHIGTYDSITLNVDVVIVIGKPDDETLALIKVCEALCVILIANEAQKSAIDRKCLEFDIYPEYFASIEYLATFLEKLEIAPEEGPLRFVQSVGWGRVLTGSVSLGDEVYYHGAKTQISQLCDTHSNYVNNLEPLQLGYLRVVGNIISRGDIITSYELRGVRRITVEFHNLAVPVFSSGYDFLFHFAGDIYPCSVTKLIGKRNNENKFVKCDSFVLSGTVVICKLKFSEFIYPDTNVPKLSRFIARDNGKIVGWGIIK